MSPHEARELLTAQAHFGGNYNRDAARRLLAEVAHEHGREAAEALIRELKLDEVFGLGPGMQDASP